MTGFFDAPAYDFLGSTVLTASAQTTASVAWTGSYDLLLVQVTVTSYSGSDIASLRFNGDAGTATTYSTRYLSSAAAATTFATNSSNQSASLARLFSQGTTLGRSALVAISNSSTAGVFKYGAVSSSWVGAGATAATAPPIDIGNFFYTGNQITSMLLLTAGGTVTMGAGTGFAVFGRAL